MEDSPYAPPKSNLADFVPSDSISLYSPRQIYTGAFLGGPLAGAWLLSRNFHLLAKSADRRNSLLVGIIVAIGLFPLVLVLPKSFPNVVVPIAYSYPFYYFAQRRFTVDGGIVFRTGWQTWLKIIGISVAWLALTIIIWMAAWMLTAQFLPDVLPK